MMKAWLWWIHLSIKLREGYALSKCFSLNVLMFITHAIHITTVLVCLVHAKFSCTSHAPQCLFCMLQYHATCPLCSWHVICLSQPCSTYMQAYMYMHHTYIYIIHCQCVVSLLSVCSRPCALLSVICYITKAKKSSLVQAFRICTVKRCYAQQALFQ